MEVGYCLGLSLEAKAAYDKRILELEKENTELLEKVEQLQAEIEEYEEAADKCCYESQCNAELNRLEALCKRLKDENEQLQAERDVAVKSLRGRCFECKHNKTSVCLICSKDKELKYWQWRGVTKED